ncbi:MAG: HD domain-containing protein [Synechococcus sp.]
MGTNSVHTVIVEVDPATPSFNIIAREKATVRLGETDARGYLTEAAMERTLAAIERAIALAKSFQAEDIVGVATSATREAPNGADFLERIHQQLSLEVDLISGQEEARRIYLGVLSAVHLRGQPHIIIDIGGGSTELILGTGEEALFLRSVKVGAVRLTRHFLSSNPPSRKEYKQLQSYINGMLERPAECIRILQQGVDPQAPIRVIGTSGTIEALAAVDAHMKKGAVPASLHGYRFDLDSLGQLVEYMWGMTSAERSKIPGLNERRAEIILAGAAILHETLMLLGAPEISVCERALREGLIVNWMLDHNLIENRLRFQSQVRRRHVYRMAKKFQVDIPFAERVADFATSLFDQTQSVLHKWGDRERELLWAAALLHNCGHFVSHSAHHKHSYYLIRNGELLGFTEEEIEVIANLARYHRKSPPKKKHAGYQNLLDNNYRRMVAQLSTLLRLATALHRRPTPAIASVNLEFETREKTLHVKLTPIKRNDDCSLELWALDFKKAVFEEQFGYKLSACLVKKQATSFVGT